MKQTLKSLGRWLAGLVAAVVLALGAQAAFAGPASAMTCPDDGFNTLGEKPSSNACQLACDAVHGMGIAEGHWNPSSHCCSCLL
jgi:hypothetical protein